jgi:lathosterol oxidase
MSIYSCLADAARLGSLSQGENLVPAAATAALPAAGDWQFDAPTAIGFVVGSVVTGLGLYLLVAAYFQLRYYRARRVHSKDWKCQPQRFPTPRMWSIDLWLGIANITGASVLSGMLAYWIYASGHSRMYISPRGHSLLSVIGGTVLYFLITDVVIYWAHRLYHRPLLFRLIHRFHHRNTVPTAFTAFSLHPVEFLTYQSIMLVPLIFLPLNAIGVIVVLLSSHIESLIQHSGVRVFPWIPWMPSTFFHDDHHRYFHVNYGQHLTLWDRLYGTLRRHGRRYGVEVFGGQGAPLSESAKEPVRFVDYSRRSALALQPDTAIGSLRGAAKSLGTSDSAAG